MKTARGSSSVLAFLSFAILLPACSPAERGVVEGPRLDGAAVDGAAPPGLARPPDAAMPDLLGRPAIADGPMGRDGGGSGGVTSPAAPASPDARILSAGGPPALLSFIAQPEVIDRAADANLDAQYAFLDTRVPSVGKLVVYLGYLNSKPRDSASMLQYLASLGFHVLSPQYTMLGGGVCESDADADCFANVRLEVLDGADHGPKIRVSRPNSIEERVARFLAYLEKMNPEGDWGRYLDGDAPRWSEIVVSGHSQGAAAAGFIGTVRAVHRVVMLCGPQDLWKGAPAPWTKKMRLTPVERIFEFSHQADSLSRSSLANCRSMGLTATVPEVNVESVMAPFHGAQVLLTGFPPPMGARTHFTILAGAESPKLPDGTYRYAPVWSYLYKN